MSSVGKRMNYKRKEFGFTLKSLSERCGISVSFLNDIEHERRRPSLNSLKKIAAGLNTTVAYLLGEEKEEPAKHHQFEGMFYSPEDKSLQFREVLDKIDGFDNWSIEDREELLTYLRLKEKLRKTKKQNDH